MKVILKNSSLVFEKYQHVPTPHVLNLQVADAAHILEGEIYGYSSSTANHIMHISNEGYKTAMFPIGDYLVLTWDQQRDGIAGALFDSSYNVIDFSGVAGSKDDYNPGKQTTLDLADFPTAAYFGISCPINATTCGITATY